MLNVWLVNPFDNLPSEGNRAQRYWLMAEAFVRAGCRVVYWTSDFSHATKAKRRGRNEVEVEKGIEVVQIPTLPYKKNICLTRIRSHRKLARDFEKLAIGRVECGEHADLIIASTPPLGLCDVARRVARKFGAKFVADVQDAWPETFERVLPRVVWRMCGMVSTARRIYREADGVSAVAQRYLELARKYGSEAPMHLAGHCIDMRHGKREAHDGKSPRLKLAYAGNMSLSYDLGTVIKAVKGILDVTLDIAGNGPDMRRLQELAKGESRIRFHGYLGEAELAELLRECDVGVVPMFPASCVGVPGKLADYAAAGLLVIESLGGECWALVDRHHAGVHYEAGDIESFKAAVGRMGRFEHVDHDAFARQFDANVVMDEYVKWVNERFSKLVFSAIV